ncbi:MAG: zinc ribbon domain-containing protein [Acidobacteria bacterium]|nr:zinc ribbon domain-containing protein [Acidobacteriota bacterium]MBU4308050.1 zinc ribbon domain-containing protein [Acidobacteriota bacterium]MBU4405043.1 zinc ribbon domain-containing protein [Acidobacteriota bacterium]MCG2810076.1 zinc ribbon domain-containing protein [Candidatus Aminicenantes bacterium]
MPTYEYECEKCGLKFERRQAISALPVTECPECCGKVRRLVSAGAGFIIKGSGQERSDRSGSDCSLEKTGRTCCGQDERCGKPPCGDGE